MIVFKPGNNTNNYVVSTNVFTKGYDGVQTASTSDDVITIVFQDESYSMYHGQYATWNIGDANTLSAVDQPTTFYTVTTHISLLTIIV